MAIFSHSLQLFSMSLNSFMFHLNLNKVPEILLKTSLKLKKDCFLPLTYKKLSEIML